MEQVQASDGGTPVRASAALQKATGIQESKHDSELEFNAKGGRSGSEDHSVELLSDSRGLFASTPPSPMVGPSK